ncbi:MAG: hypothetical protein ABI165_03845 [Bryobacteraceae bacterium]
MKINKIEYAGWPNCYRLANDAVELVVTADVGPRVIRYGFIGGQNLFVELPGQMGTTGESTWTPRGGHRIWVAPELVPGTYALDNSPVKVNVENDAIESTGAVEPETGLEKFISVRLAPSGSAITVVHRIRNAASRPRTLAPWAVSMMAPGGMGIAAFPPRGTHPEVLPPTHPLVMWAFTDLSDPRWKFTQKYMLLRSDVSASAPQKLGLFNPKTVGAYLLGTDLFVKRYQAHPVRPYPDFGCSFETFTNAQVLELETLGPLATLAPGESVEHVEHWSLHPQVRISAWTDAELDRIFLPLLIR